MESFSLKQFFKGLGIDERAADLVRRDWPRLFIGIGIGLIMINSVFKIYQARREREAQRVLDENEKYD